jgi:lipopolysaccharide export LptBFGC system permease protein LptF
VKFGKVSSSLSWNTKKLCKALVDAPINFLKIAQNELKNEKDMGLKLTRGLELFFQKNWSKLLIIIFMCFLGCSFIYDVQRIVVALQFPCPMT